MSKEKTACYNTLSRLLNKLDTHMNEIKEHLACVRSDVENKSTTPIEEECPDVAPANKAAMDAIEGICLEIIADREPEGEA